MISNLYFELIYGILIYSSLKSSVLIYFIISNLIIEYDLLLIWEFIRLPQSFKRLAFLIALIINLFLRQSFTKHVSLYIRIQFWVQCLYRLIFLIDLLFQRKYLDLVVDQLILWKNRKILHARMLQEILDFHLATSASVLHADNRNVIACWDRIWLRKSPNSCVV